MMKKEKQVEEIVIMAQSGDYSRFSELYQIHKNELYYFLLTLLKVKSDAEDIVQETFITAFEHIEDLKNPKSFKTWIYSIAYSKAMNANTNIRTQQESLSEYPHLEGETKSKGMTDYEKNALMNEIAGAMNKLTPKLYTVAELKYMQGFTIKEISEILDIPEGTVKNRLMRTKEIMTENLRLRGVTPYDNSVSLSSMMTLFFSERENIYILSRYTDSEILKRMSGLSSTKVHTKSHEFFHILKEGITRTGLGCVVLGSVVTGGVVIKNYNNTLEIEHIDYSNEWSNSGIVVKVLFDNNISSNDLISIVFDSKEIESQSENKTLTFTAYEKGIYKILTETQEREIEIACLDYQNPQLVSVEKETDGLLLYIEDKDSQPNYDKSYILYDGEKIKIPSTGKLKGQFNGSMKVVLYDHADNYSEYNIDVSTQNDGDNYD